jgi:hypothetical protein
VRRLREAVLEERRAQGRLTVSPRFCGPASRLHCADFVQRHRLVKGCGGTSPLEGPGTAPGGNEGSSDDRGGAGGGDRDGSPRSIKREL